MFGRKKQVAAARDAVSAEDTAPTTPGPHDRATVGDIREYYTDLEYGHIDLGSLVIGVPKGRDLNVALDPNGLPEFHVVTKVSRVIPRAFAAPKSPGQWRTMVTEMREQLEKQNADVTVVDGPWGRELVAEMPGAVFRAIGVDGNRWTAEVRIMATPDLAEQAAEEGREVFQHLLINRGDGPMPAKEQLPLTIPDEIQQALTKAQSQLAAQKQAQAYQQQMAAGGSPQQASQSQQPTAQSRQPNAQPQQAGAQPQQPAPDARSEQTDGPSRESKRGGSAMDRLRGTDDDL